MEEYSFIIFLASIGVIAINIFVLVKFLQIANDLRELKEFKKKQSWKSSENHEEISTILKEFKLLLEENKLK